MHALMESLEFTADDLAANRAGTLSSRQRRRLQRAIFRHNVAYWLTALFFYAVALAIEPWAYTWSDGRFLAAVFIMVLATGGLYYLLAESEAHSWAIAEGHVATITGIVRCEHGNMGHTLRTGGDLYIQIHDQRFYVPWKAFETFIDGGKYTLYYLPAAQRVLSATPAQHNNEPLAAPAVS